MGFLSETSFRFVNRFFTGSMLILGLQGCGNSNGIDIPKEISRVTGELTAKNQANILLVSVSSIDEKQVTFTFENDRPVDAPAVVVQNVDWDSDVWQATVNFVDGTSLSLGALGSPVSFEVLPLPGDRANKFPLVRNVSFEVPHPGFVRYLVAGKYDKSSNFEYTTEALNRGSHEIDVLGLYGNWDNRITLEYLSETGYIRSTVTLQVLTTEPEFQIPIYQWRQANEQDQQRFYLHGHRAPSCNRQIYIFDQFGDIRWMVKDISNYAIQQISTGELLFVSDGTAAFTIMTLNGERHDKYFLPAPFTSIHHDVEEVSPTQFLLTVNDSRKGTIEDVVVLFDTDLQEVTRVWDLEEVLPKSYEFINDPDDWFHMNAISFDSRDRSLLLSGQRYGLVKLSWDGELVWIISDPKRFQAHLNDNRYADKIFNSYDEDYFTWGQHDVEVDPTSGFIYVFDNGLGRDYSNVNEYSRGVLFEVDEIERSFGVKSEYGSSFDEYFSPIISGLDSSDSRVLLNYGSTAYNFNYIDNYNWVDRQNFRVIPTEYGAALMEFSKEDGSVISEVTISCLDDNNWDAGIYRIEYVDLLN